MATNTALPNIRRPSVRKSVSVKPEQIAVENLKDQDLLEYNEI